MDKRYVSSKEKENLYNERNLFLLNIRELRDIGRKLGVVSPTTMKKEVLVDSILKIIYGEVKTEVRSAYGRPSVREFDINHYLEKIKKRSQLSPDDVDSVFKVASHEEKDLTNEVVQRIFVEDNGKFFIRERGFVASKTDIEVSRETVEKFGLENFDVVEVIVEAEVFKIISVNGEMVNDLNSTIKQTAKSGQKQVFNLRTKEEIQKEIRDLEKSCEDNNVHLMVFSSDEYFGKNTHCVVVENDEQPNKVYKKLVSFVDACEKCVFENKNIVVAVDVFDFVNDAIDSFENESSARIKKHLQQKFETLLKLGNALNIYKIENERKY